MAPDGTLLGFARAGSRRGRRHVHRDAHHALDDQSALPRVAMADAMDRASAVALVCRPGRRPARLVADDSPAWWLRHRLRFAVRMRAARYSIRAALGQALQHGLPLAAVIAATVPVWGMSWYFDTENWAAGMWNSWAESRTDTWRAAMVRAVLADDQIRNEPLPFVVRPPGVDDPGDFSFIVIGDTGEGDASQHILRDQLLSVANHPDVRFVVISSDVVYPVGSMNDYEAKFWLPFKGVTKPVYAIPGNHDWYDALEAFAATFLDARSAHLAMRARVESDLRFTSTTDERIAQLIGHAGWLRKQYQVPTGFQRAPVLRDSDRGLCLDLRRHGRRQEGRS